MPSDPTVTSIPKVSVLMPAYKSEKYIKAAVDSILAQTFTDFEILVILNEDPGSTDTTRDIVRAYADPRIRLIDNKEMGLSVARNIGIKLAKGAYIANLDADDVSLPTRLEKQVNFLDTHPDFGMVGTWIENIDKAGAKTGGVWAFPAPADEVPTILFFINYFGQSAVMMRKSAIPAGGYDVKRPVAEDYDLWIRITDSSKAWNLPEILTQIRNHGENTTLSNLGLHPPTTRSIYGARLDAIGMTYTPEELDMHYAACVGTYGATPDHAERLRAWFERMNAANMTSKKYDPTIFAKALIGRWYIFSKTIDPRWYVPGSLFWKGVGLPCERFRFPKENGTILQIPAAAFPKVRQGQPAGHLHLKTMQKIKRTIKRLIGDDTIYVVKDIGNKFRPSRAHLDEIKENAVRKAFYAQFLGSGDVFFDIGANDGNRVAPVLELGAKVVAFEPQRACRNILRWRFGKKITVVPKALGEKDDTKEMHISNFSGVSSISTEWINAVKDTRFKGYDWSATRKVQVTTLDKAIEKYGMPKFAKIDVEGYELEVLKGLSKAVPALSFEYTTPEQTDKVLACIKKIAALDPHYAYNYSVGESMKLALGTWLSADDMLRLVATPAFIATDFGDIYARTNHAH